jgi:hypothetical protein
MVREAVTIDVTNMPELSALVRDVARTGRPRLLQADGAAAVLSPARRSRSARATTQEEFESALNATFGAWKDLIDPDEFKRQRRELQEHDREPRFL